MAVVSTACTCKFSHGQVLDVDALAEDSEQTLEGTRFAALSPSGLRLGNLIKILAYKINVIGTRRIVETLPTNAKWRCSFHMMIPLCLIDTTPY